MSLAHESPEVAALDRDLRALIDAGDVAPREPESAFRDLAMRVFTHQYHANAPYRRLCVAEGVAPDTVRSLIEIPACPTEAFKEFALTTFPVGEAAAEFHSSGTTADQTSRHYLPHLNLYHASLWASFADYVIPDCVEDEVELDCLVLAPPSSATPHSSLGHMLQTVADRIVGGVTWLLPGPDDPSALLDALAAFEGSGRPVLLLGTAFAFVHACDALTAGDASVALPPLSRAMETGGYKGRSRTLAPAALHALIARSFDVRPAMIENEYGMTEMGSQSYDGTIRQALGFTGGRLDRVKHAPPWCRSWVVDPADVNREVADGDEGILKHLDLVNRGSVSCLLTEDRARRVGEGYVVLGRADGAQLRGCSLAMEELRNG